MADHDARQFLAALAGDGDDDPALTPASEAGYQELIDGAVAATAEFESAAAFLAEEDLDALAEAVERAEADLSQRGERGRAALEKLRRLEAAADPDRQFQSGLRTSLGDGDLAAGR